MKVDLRKRIIATNKCKDAYFVRKIVLPDNLPICIGLTIYCGDFEFTVADMGYDMARETLELWSETVKTDMFDERVERLKKDGWKEK